MSGPSAQEFLQALLEALDGLPADFARRFEEVLKKDDADRSQAIRQLFGQINQQNPWTTLSDRPPFHRR